MTGKDGKLFLSVDDQPVELLEIDTYSVKANYTNLDYQPVGSYQKFSVPGDVSYTLTFTEAVVRDDVIMEPLLAAAKNGKNISFTFRASAISVPKTSFPAIEKNVNFTVFSREFRYSLS